MMRDNISRWNFGIAVLVTIIITLPYLLGFIFENDEVRFNGFLLNPIDGSSYLAKMEEGRQGSWLFHFRYSPETVNGAPYYFLYIFLGHVAGLFNLDNILIFHIARILFSWLLLFILNKVVHVIFSAKPWLAVLTFAWLTISGGMGWLLLGSGTLPGDLWVAEAYPFLSMFSNPHFPAGISLLLSAFLIYSYRNSLISVILLSFISLLLSIVFPFAVIIGIVSLGLLTFWNLVARRSNSWLKFVSFAIPGGLWSVGQQVIALQDLYLSQWNAQNIAITGSFGAFLLSFSPGLILAVAAIFWIKPWRDSILIRLITCWLFVAVLIAFVPFSSQRRFLIGFQIPVILLASTLLDRLSSARNLSKISAIVAFVLTLPSVILIIAGSINGVMSKSDSLFMSRDTLSAIYWLGNHSEPEDVILASAINGRHIPAIINRRVVYGHPIESIKAVERLRIIDEIFAGKGEGLVQIMTTLPIRYVLIDKSEYVNLKELDGMQFTLVGDWNGVQIFESKR